MKQAGFFDVEERLARLSGLGDQLDADFFCDGVDGSQRHRDVPR